MIFDYDNDSIKKNKLPSLVEITSDINNSIIRNRWN